MSIETTGTPKISIVTICRNSADTLERALRSVAGQTYRNFECILIDGASTDGTMAIVEKYRHLFAAVSSEPDRGIADAFNKGLRAASGDLVAFLNSDDWYASPDVLKAVADRYAGQDVVLCGSIASCGVDGRLLKRYDSKPDKLRYGMYVPHPASFVPGALIARVGQFNPNLKIAMDYEYFVRLQLSGAKFQVIPMILTNMQLGGASSDWRRSLAEDFAIKRNFFGIDVRILVNHWLHAIILGVKATLAGRSR